MPPPRYTLRHGAMLLHVSNGEDLHTAMVAMRESMEAPSVSSIFVQSADAILAAAATAAPRARFEMFCFMAASVNAAHSPTRHTPPADVASKVSQVVNALRGQR